MGRARPKDAAPRNRRCRGMDLMQLRTICLPYVIPAERPGIFSSMNAGCSKAPCGGCLWVPGIRPVWTL